MMAAPQLHSAGLADATRSALDALGAPLVAEFLEAWPRAPGERPVQPAALPALRFLPTIATAAPQVAPSLVGAVLSSAATLAWHQTYTAREMSADFLDNYAWTEVLGLRGPMHSERLACGFLLLGPRTHYPSHCHAAEELYVPLSGRAEWRQGDGIWRLREPGTVIEHRSEELHAMRTQDEPLLAVYLWRGGDLAQKARLAVR
jgi:hypothetical protein